MKYKNRLIVPTLVSTGLLASTIVVNAEEVEQDEQYSAENTEEYSQDNSSETDLDFIAEDEDESEPPEDEEDEEESEEEATEDEDIEEEVTEESAEDEEADEAPEVQEEETVEEEAASEVEEELEAPEEEAEESEDGETEEEASEENIEEQETAEEETEVTEDGEAVNEEAEEPEVQEEAAEEDPVSEVEEEEAAEEDGGEEDTAVDEAAEEASVEEPAEESVEEEQEISEQEPESEDEKEKNDLNGNDTIADEEEAAAQEPAEEAEEVNKTEEEAVADDAPAVEESEAEESTYEYDSDSVQQELEDLSDEERSAFLEENADDIEVDEETMNELTAAISEDYGIEAEAAEVYSASTMSTMSLSQAIDDINEYIAANDFEVAPIQYDYIEGLPQYGYYSDYGSEEGVVGKPEGVVLHDVGNDNSTIHGEISYMSDNWENAFVHAFVDADNIIQVADTDYLAYGAGPVSNQLHMHVELVRHDNAHDFARSINNYADYIANLLYKYKLPVVSAEDTGEGTLWSHVAVSEHLKGTNSPDPYEYFGRFGYEYNDVIDLIGQRYDDMYNKRTAPRIAMPIEEGTTNAVAQVSENNTGLYESVADVRTLDASSLAGETFYVDRTATYNYENYYLLQNEEGVPLGWMHEGDLLLSEYVPEPELPEEPTEPEVPTEPEEDDANEESGEDSGDSNEQVEDGSGEVSEDEETEPAEPEAPELPEEDADDNTDDQVEEDSNEDSEAVEEAPEEDVSDEETGVTEESSDEQADEAAEQEAEEAVEENTSNESDIVDDEEEVQEPEIDYATANSIQIPVGDTIVGELIAPGTYLVTNQNDDGGNIAVWYTNEYGTESARIIEIIGTGDHAAESARVTLVENDRISIENTDDMLFTPASDLVENEDLLGITQTDEGFQVIPGEFIVGEGIPAGSYTISNTDDHGSNFVVWAPENEYGYEELKYNEIIGTGDHAVPSLEIVLANGDRIEITGTSNILFSPDGIVPEEEPEESDESTDAPEEDVAGGNEESDQGSDAGTPDAESDEDEVTTGTGDTEVEEVSSTLVDPATGVRVVSETGELEGKSLVVTVLNPSDAIDAAHDLYDIQILDEDGSLYSLENPVTVYLPANGLVSNVYYLGDIGETLEAVNFTTEDGYAVFEVADFSQYAVVYGVEGADNTTVAPVSGNKGTPSEETSTDRTNEHSAVYTEKDTAETEAQSSADAEATSVSTDEADDHVEAAEQAGPEKQKGSEAEILPNTGVAEQSTTIFATILAALGLGFLMKRRKPTDR